MNEPLSKIPSGMRYYFGAEARLRRAVEDRVMSVFDGWSYEEITTPSVDYNALFERGMGQTEAQRAFRFTDTDGRMLALRSDVTSSVARAAATLFAARPRPLRFCYAASVFRQRPRSRAEWRRQNRQLGCELIGAGSSAADMEVLLIAVEVLEKLGFNGRYRITLNHVGVLNGLSEQFALDVSGRERMREMIDTRDDANLKSFFDGYAPAGMSDALAGNFTKHAGKLEIMRNARVVLKGARAVAALDALEEVWRVVEALELDKAFEIDMADVSGLDYYTGLIFKIYVEGAGTRVGSGGRYDDLTGNFGRSEAAVGFVLDLDAITDVLAKGNTFESNDFKQPTPSIIEDDSQKEAFRDARRRRESGEKVRLDEGGA